MPEMINQVTAAMDLKAKPEEWFGAFRDRYPAAIQHIQTQARDTFRATGFPHTKLEDWKYTPVRNITGHPYLLPWENDASAGPAQVENTSLTSVDAYYAVFVNGILDEKQSVLPEQEGFVIQSLGSMEAGEQLARHLGTVAEMSSGFIALNTALYTCGLLIHARKNAVLDKPLILYHFATAGADPLLIQPRHLLIGEEGSEFKVAEVYAGKGNIPTLTNAVTEIKAGPNAHIDYSKIQLETGQNYHVGTTEIAQSEDSSVASHTITLEGAFIRNNLHFHMHGRHCTSVMNGLYFLNGEQFVDNHTLVDHAVPHCLSDQLYKGIMDEQATAVFNGKVHVKKDAQKTNAYQRNVNILLSDEATINTKPQLEIFADDVRCTHGATSGYLDDEAIFYLRARGISEGDARNLLLHAYAAEIIDKIQVKSLAEPLMELVSSKFKL